MAFAGFVEGFGQVFLFVDVAVDLLDFLGCPGIDEHSRFEGLEEEVDGVVWVVVHIAFLQRYALFFRIKNFFSFIFSMVTLKEVIDRMVWMVGRGGSMAQRRSCWGQWLWERWDWEIKREKHGKR